MNFVPAILVAFVALAPRAQADGEPGAVGGPPLALHAAKALTCANEKAGSEVPEVIFDPVLVIEDGKITAIGKGGDVEIPEGAVEVDLGEAWLTPGMVDLHSHVGGSRGDINDMVIQTNPGLRVAPAVIPGNDFLHVPIAAGVTTILFIPGSGTNIGGQGVLMKLGHKDYEDSLVRDPGSLKIAQGDNPTRWGYGMRRSLMAWNLSTVLRRGRAYADAWKAHQEEGGEAPERALDLDVFRELYARRTQVSTHTQYYQLVLTTVTLLARDFGLPTYIDHGSFDSYLTGPLAKKHDVAAILGPRSIMAPSARFETDGRIEGTAWGFENHGQDEVGFNTDAPVIPQEDLPVQATMQVRFGFSHDRMQGLRGLTIVPARTAGIADRVGSLEPGKDADILVTTGDPVDPRTRIEATYIDGIRFYDAERDGRRW